MDITENFNKSFDYVKKLSSDGGRLIILIVLDLIPIVNWIVLGYAARVLREPLGSEAPPKLERYGEMFVDGAKVFFASLIYMLIPLVLIGAGALSFIASFFSLQGQMMAPSVVFGGTGLALAGVGVVLAIILMIFLGVGIAHMIKIGKFGKVFAFGEILNTIRGIGWGRYLSWIVLVVIISVIISGLAGLIPYAGWVISAIISPFLSVFIFRSLGLLYNDGASPELRGQGQAPALGGLVCASCGTPLQSNQKFCPSCGAAAPAPPPPTTAAGTKFCISCGAKIPANANFCGSCSAKQT